MTTGDSLDLVLGLDGWEVTLKSGDVITVRALAYSREDNVLIFTGLERGTPNRDVELVRIPARLVDSVRGGFRSDTSRPLDE